MSLTDQHCPKPRTAPLQGTNLTAKPTKTASELRRSSSGRPFSSRPSPKVKPTRRPRFCPPGFAERTLTAISAQRFAAPAQGRAVKTSRAASTATETPRRFLPPKGAELLGIAQGLPRVVRHCSSSFSSSTPKQNSILRHQTRNLAFETHPAVPPPAGMENSQDRARPRQESREVTRRRAGCCRQRENSRRREETASSMSCWAKYLRGFSAAFTHRPGAELTDQEPFPGGFQPLC